MPVTSSLPPEFARTQEKLYREVLQQLNRQSVPYAVSGAFALQQHTGIWRDTKDLDLFLTFQNVPKALQCLREQGYECEVCDPVWLAKAHRGDFFVDLITGMSNAAITVTDDWIERASPAIVVDVKTRVLAAEELIASKLFVTRRERFDGADIAHVIYGTRGEFDWSHLLNLIGEHWEVLLFALVLFRYIYPAQTHYVPAGIWNELLARFQAEVQTSDPQARFRGSLIDENMFAIDVKEWQLDDVLTEYRARRMRTLRTQDQCDRPGLSCKPHP